jgi:transglutaminase-like putative cysteine protease
MDIYLEDKQMNAQTNDMQAYLTVTELCDHDDPWLLEVAEEIVAGANKPAEKAIRIFYHVRDRVRFSISFSRSKASQTLKRGYGDCVSKTNAQVALLRAQGIPARLRRVKVKSVILHHLITDFVYKQMPPTASHFWPECYLNGKWISCEAFLDKPLYEGMLKRGMITQEQVPTIDWDGATDLIILEPWITEQLGSVPSADEAIAGLQTSDEGMLPLWVEKMIAPFFYPYNLRYSDSIRQLA